MKKLVVGFLGWWPVWLLLLLLVLSAGGAHSTRSAGAQSYDERQQELQQDAQQSYQEQMCRGN